MCNFLLVINTYILFRTISKLLQLIDKIFAFDKGYLYSTHSFGVNP